MVPKASVEQEHENDFPEHHRSPKPSEGRDALAQAKHAAKPQAGVWHTARLDAQAVAELLPAEQLVGNTSLPTLLDRPGRNNARREGPLRVGAGDQWRWGFQLQPNTPLIILE